MKPQVQPNRWSCFITSFAMVLDLDVSELIKEIGHDGSETIWSHASFPMCKRGFHIQELIDVCQNHGYAVTVIEAIPVLCSPEHVEYNKVHGTGLRVEYDVPFNVNITDRLKNAMKDSMGVLYGLGASKCRHAVAVCGDQIIDPANGQEIDLSRFSIQCFYKVQKVHFGLDVK